MPSPHSRVLPGPGRADDFEAGSDVQDLAELGDRGAPAATDGERSDAKEEVGVDLALADDPAQLTRLAADEVGRKEGVQKGLWRGSSRRAMRGLRARLSVETIRWRALRALVDPSGIATLSR